MRIKVKQAILSAVLVHAAAIDASSGPAARDVVGHFDLRSKIVENVHVVSHWERTNRMGEPGKVGAPKRTWARQEFYADQFGRGRIDSVSGTYMPDGRKVLGDPSVNGPESLRG